MSGWIRWRVGAGLVALILLAGCGDTTTTGTTSPGAAGTASSGATTAKAPRACAVLTADLVTPVIGADAKQTRDAQPNPKETQCQYTSSTGSINVMVGDWTVIKPISSTTPVSGVGDEASSSASGTNARKGTLGVSVLASLAFGTFTGDEATNLETRQRAAEKDLAVKLLAKL